MFDAEKDIENLSNEAERKGFKFGIHYPLRAGKLKLRDPQFLSLNEEVKNDAYRDIEDELEYIKKKQIIKKIPRFEIISTISKRGIYIL